MRRVGVEERRARLALRHRLVAPAQGPVEAARDVVALHATDPASVYLSAFARMSEPDPAAVERGLYDDRALVGMLGMRRTVWVVPVELAPVVQAACTRAIAARERRRLEQHLAQAGVARDAGAWLRELEEETVGKLSSRGEATAVELSQDVPGLARQILVGEGTKWAAKQGVSTRVLAQLAADGRIVRGRPRGGWTSGQYRWATIDAWLPGERVEWSTGVAQAELARRWLAAFGPASAGSSATHGSFHATGSRSPA